MLQLLLTALELLLFAQKLSTQCMFHVILSGIKIGRDTSKQVWCGLCRLAEHLHLLHIF